MANSLSKPAAEQLISFKASEVAGSNCYQIIDMRSEQKRTEDSFYGERISRATV